MFKKNLSISIQFCYYDVVAFCVDAFLLLGVYRKRAICPIFLAH